MLRLDAAQGLLVGFDGKRRIRQRGLHVRDAIGEGRREADSAFDGSVEFACAPLEGEHHGRIGARFRALLQGAHGKAPGLGQRCQRAVLACGQGDGVCARRYQRAAGILRGGKESGTRKRHRIGRR